MRDAVNWALSSDAQAPLRFGMATCLWHEKRSLARGMYKGSLSFRNEADSEGQWQDERHGSENASVSPIEDSSSARCALRSGVFPGPSNLRHELSQLGSQRRTVQVATLGAWVHAAGLCVPSSSRSLQLRRIAAKAVASQNVPC